ncbi:MAG: class I SAM-dependent methyltransferase [Verrucomicrobia bacterium]|nr:class I SAM-dependent methyltransferase [Verrucomicrobiota bacterium]
MKEKRRFPIFNSHLDLAHLIWAKAAQKGDWAIDATCGNGHDTVYLAQHYDRVIGLDIQERALENTQKLLLENGLSHKVALYHQSHETFPSTSHPVRLVVYNLGYLPGGDKGLTTQVQSTLTSIGNALSLIVPGGLVSLTCYPGHPEGQREEGAVLELCRGLPSDEWSVSFHSWQNRQKAPSLVLIQKTVAPL